MHHTGIQHPFHAGVLPENSFAHAQILQVVTHRVLSDVPPLAARLELQFFLFWHIQFRCGCRQFPVPQLLSGFPVHHSVQFRRAFRFGGVPLLGGRADQHEPRCRTGLAQRNKEAHHRMRAVCVLVSIFFIARGLHNFHARPVRIEFVRNNARQGGSHAVAHFRAVRDDVCRSIRVERQINARLQRSFAHGVCGVRACICRNRKQLLRLPLHAQYKSARTQHALQKSAPAA